MEQEKQAVCKVFVGESLAKDLWVYCLNPGVFKSARDARSAIRTIELWARSHDGKQQN
jgi:hypothetical protein